MPFFNKQFTLSDYLKLDDGVLNTYFLQWEDSEDPILNDLANRFLNRTPFKSARISNQTRALLPELKQLVAAAGFDAEYYTAENDSYDLPYDAYDPTSQKPRTQFHTNHEQITTQIITDPTTGKLTRFYDKSVQIFRPRLLPLSVTITRIPKWCN